ncbi:MAG: AAA family ATPase, partial [Bacteroidia bacterium]|nr:AAA family ATPase [Bacteroidia bacterium]
MNYADLNRIMIIGCCGAGKSTLATRLHEILDLPLIHLDQHYHLPEWREPSKEEWEQIATDLASGDQWIIDGNYGGTMDIRIPRADLILFMDYPTHSCISRIIKRTWKYHGKVRPDMAPGCPERFDWEFLHYTATFRMTKRAGILDRLK